jgi:hypothetical protein
MAIISHAFPYRLLFWISTVAVLDCGWTAIWTKGGRRRVKHLATIRSVRMKTFGSRRSSAGRSCERAFIWLFDCNSYKISLSLYIYISIFLSLFHTLTQICRHTTIPTYTRQCNTHILHSSTNSLPPPPLPPPPYFYHLPRPASITLSRQIKYRSYIYYIF